MDAFMEGSLTKKFNDMGTMSLVSTLIHQEAEEKQHQMMEDMKVDKRFANYDRRDQGYLVTFEHENEAQDLLNRKSNQTLFHELLGEKEHKIPYFIRFEILNEYCKNLLKDRLFSVSSLNSFDLIKTKQQIMKVGSYLIC